MKSENQTGAFCTEAMKPQIILNENLPPEERYLQFGRKTEPTPEIREKAERKAREVGITPEQPITREQSIAIVRSFLEDQAEFHSLGLEEARRRLQELTPLTDKEEQEAMTPTKGTESPYQKRIKVWERKYNPASEQKARALQIFKEIEKLEAVEAANAHQRTAAEINEGQLKGQEDREKVFIGCSDPALLLLSKLRCVGIPASYVQCVSKEWIDQLRNMTEEAQEKELAHNYRGHVLVKVYLPNEASIWVDPMGGAIQVNDHWERFNPSQGAWERRSSSLGPYYLVREEIDSTDSAPSTPKTKKRLKNLIKTAPEAFAPYSNKVLIPPEA